MWSLILMMRIRMTRRFLRRLGILRSTLVGVFLLGFLSQLFLVDSGRGGYLTVALGCAALLYALHTLRGDRSLLASLDLDATWLMRMEYAMLASPVLFLLAWRGQWAALVFLVATLVFLPGLKPTVAFRKPTLQWFLQPIPFTFYEWRSGLRRTWPVLLPLLALSAAGGMLHPMIGWAGLFLLAALSLSHYRDGEPLEYIRQLGDTPGSFLFRKVISGLLAYGLLCLPVAAVLLARYPGDFTYVLAFWGANALLVAATVVGKYAFYEEGRNLELVLSVLFAILCLMMIIPYLPAAALLTFGWLAFRAQRRTQAVAYA
ncbi:MAG: hypothetical protein U5K31_11220 [Balneolaceae bacterium]|nr:hypothetical protein [Balneolaceae bacterium]